MVRFRILGPVEFWTGQAWAGIGAPKWRSLLAALLINAGQVVSTDRLIEEIWGDSPPAGATNLVSIYALRLRRLIGDENGEVLRTRSPGYQVAVEPGDLDAALFDALVRKARQALAGHKDEHAAGLLSGALDLWKGGVLIDVPRSPLVVAEAERLEAARLDALELRIGADMGCGRHAQVIAELFRLSADHPLREGLWGLLMRALDGAGRHAEALTTYQRAREVISEELGVDPGAELQQVFEELLTKDDRQPGRAGREAGMARVAQAEPRPFLAPRQLPADIGDFTGRMEDLKRLYELQPRGEDDGSPGAPMVALVGGAGGLGKTTLTIHAAHRLRSRFPDGQLYVNLLGATAQPMAPADVLARFLRDLGVGDAQIPVDHDERAALYRTRLTDRQVLILLDNARDAAQVRPLLPGSSSCAVIVTSRNTMPDLMATQIVDLDVLGKDEAWALFAGIVGAGRARAELAATQEVLDACAGLPLAIRIAGARLAARPRWTVSALAERLRRQQGRSRLDELKVGELAVRNSFDVSFADLPRAATPEGIDPARAFQLLGLWEGSTIGLAAAAALLGQPGIKTANVLEQLVDVHLLESPALDLYRLHDLLRVYAAERSENEPAQIREAAARRILSWYLRTAEAAARTISPNHARVPVDTADPAVRPLMFGSLDEALEWAEAERANLVAATRQAAAGGLHDIAWQLPAATMSYFYRRSHWADWVITHEIGLSSARAFGDRLGEAWMLNNLGIAYGEQNRAESVDQFEQALAIYRELGNKSGEARAANNLAHALLQMERFDEALESSHESLAIQQQTGNRYGEGITLAILGATLRGLGRLTDAVSRFEQALVISRELGDHHTEADVLSDLGAVCLGLLQVPDAIASLRESLAIRSKIGDRHGQATTLKLLGVAYRQAGNPAEARNSLTEALGISDELGDHKQAEVIRAELDELTAEP